MPPFLESTVELAALAWLAEQGIPAVHGDSIAPGEPHAEREHLGQVLLKNRLRAALERLNPHIPASARPGAVDEAIRRIERVESQSLLRNHAAFHTLLIEGVDVTFRAGAVLKHDKVRLADFDHPAANDWLAVQQFAITGHNAKTGTSTHRRPDIVLFLNGLPVVVFELKNAADEHATIEHAFHQLRTYTADIAPLFTTAGLLVISDGIQARLGALGAGWEHFKPWRDPAAAPRPELHTLIDEALSPVRLLDLIRFFSVFERDGDRITKKVAAWHQVQAVNRAVERTVEAAQAEGDCKVGVVWHTQGSGKSLSMLFYAGKIIQRPEMANPTLVILTDRNDLDDQLFGTFAAGQELIRQTPVQAESRDHLRALLQRAAGGVIFTTIQKFQPGEPGEAYPLLSERRNIVFIADEAHRSQYGFSAHLVQSAEVAYLSYGFAKYVRDALPNASFIGFTGTPVESSDISTRQVFGDTIDIYDIQRAVEDGATVPIYYEARLARLKLREDQRPKLNPAFEEVTEGEETVAREKLKTKWSQLEAMVGAEERLRQVAADIVAHFEAREQAVTGKAMIVCMSRRIAVDLYAQIVALRPDWHSDRDDLGAIKVVMTGSASDPDHYQPHVRNKARRKALAERYKDPDDALKLVIVRDMWLTGFDAPPMHTMYLDKPMRGHGLMQAIARVNRVFRDKPGGVIVDYLGIATELQEAMRAYTASGSEEPAQWHEQAVHLMLDKADVVRALLHGVHYQAFFTGAPAERLGVIAWVADFIVQTEERKKRYLDAVSTLSKAFALAVPDEAALAIREEVAFLQAVRAALVKSTPVGGRSADEVEFAVKQLVSGAVASEGVVNLFDAAGLRAPNVGLLDEEFLEDVRRLPQRNLALELLRKLLNDEIRVRKGKNVVQARSFTEMLENTIRRYQNRTIDAAQVIAELIDIAHELREAQSHGAELGLSEDEVAFYDALTANASARNVMGDAKLAAIALELLRLIKANVTIDWTVKESARARIRTMVKRILRQFGYPPDLTDAATALVLEQAELVAAEWAGA